MGSERLYDIEQGEGFEETLKKFRKKDKTTYRLVIKKILQIAREPHLAKPLRNVLKGKRRVHISHFVLIYEIDENAHKVVFLKFAHHDEAYK